MLSVFASVARLVISLRQGFRVEYQTNHLHAAWEVSEFIYVPSANQVYEAMSLQHETVFGHNVLEETTTGNVCSFPYYQIRLIIASEMVSGGKLCHCEPYGVSPCGTFC